MHGESLSLYPLPLLLCLERLTNARPWRFTFYPDGPTVNDMISMSQPKFSPLALLTTSGYSKGTKQSLSSDDGIVKVCKSCWAKWKTESPRGLGAYGRRGV
jgi:hypothetical protein